MSIETLTQIKELAKEKIHAHHTHETIGRSSHEASKIRGTPVELGAKAIIFKTKQGFVQGVVPAHKRIATKKLRKIVGSKNIRLATPQEVLELTDCVVGSVPPFGVLWNIPVYVDPLLLENKIIVFSAGTLEDSIDIKSKDLVELNKAQVVDIVED